MLIIIIYYYNVWEEWLWIIIYLDSYYPERKLQREPRRLIDSYTKR